MVDTFGTGTVDEAAITRAVTDVFDLSPAGIIKTLDLCRPIYQKNRIVRTLRTRHLPLGKDRQNRRAEKSPEIVDGYSPTDFPADRLKAGKSHGFFAAVHCRKN